MSEKQKGRKRSNQQPVEHYAKLNRATYDALVDQYEARILNDTPGDLMLLAPFFYFLELRFGVGAHLSLLDIGCGNGLNLKMMADRGHCAVGNDISPGMVALAAKTAPNAAFVTGDFLEVALREKSFHGIFAKAIIHLFPKTDVCKFLGKVHRSLRTDGVFYVTTTIERFSDEGYAEKQDYLGKPLRYRARWTCSELIGEIEAAGFRLLWQSIDREHERDKTWINLWAEKSYG